MINIDFNVKPIEAMPEYFTDMWGQKCLFDENGEYHSHNGLPSVISCTGNKYWHKHGKLHRKNNLPAVIFNNGYKAWHVNGKYIKSEGSI